MESYLEQIYLIPTGAIRGGLDGFPVGSTGSRGGLQFKSTIKRTA